MFALEGAASSGPKFQMQSIENTKNAVNTHVNFLINHLGSAEI